MKKRILQAIILFIIATIAIFSGIMLIPTITNFGEITLAFVVSALILVYVYYYLLLKVLNKSRGSVLILTLIEMILLTVIAIGSIIGKVTNIMYISDTNKIIGISLWIIGLIESLRSYYYIHSYNVNYSMYRLIINLILITIGTWCFITTYFITTILVYLISVTLFIISIALIIKGILKIKTNLNNEIGYEILKD